MTMRLGSHELRGGTRRTALAAALALALGAGGAQEAQSAPGEPPVVGAIVSARAVPPAPSPPPVAGAATVDSRADGGAAASDAAPPAEKVAPPPAPSARSAAAHSATISGFAFQPGSITATVGDTISWTNEDSAPHTATADDGSFDTGQLAKGASGSHTFTAAGTFAYHCTVHPSMHGTVTVVAAVSGGGSTAGGDAAAPPAATSAPTPGPAARATLPRTGWDPVAVAVAGVALLLSGLVLRARTRPR
jgi:plastocyanin